MFGLTFILVAVAFATVYFYVQHLYSYWQRRGIPYLKPTFPFGNFGKTFLQKLPLSEQFTELYRSTSKPFIGIFMLLKPLLLIRDPKLIQSILITDFQYFTDHNHYLNEENEPLTANLGSLQGEQWQEMRAKLTPTFKPSKMKIIFSTLLDCGKQLQQHLFKTVCANQAIEMCEVTACYASNIIASALFGIDVDCFVDPNHPLRNTERQLFEINMKNALRFIGFFFQPTLLKWSGLRFVDRSVEEYFLNLVAQTLEMREQKNVVRKDFLQFLIELRNDDSNTSMSNGDGKIVSEESGQKSLSSEQVAAEAFGFLFSGIKATILAVSYCLYEVAKHPDIQQKIHAENDHVMVQHNGQLTYASINELKYLDCCIDETLRKHQLFDLNRVCVKDYKIPGTDVTIEKGTTIIIPTPALHHDEKFYPDPKKFDPTRFYNENKAGKSIIDMPYFPFGDGPRACIGQQMGKLFVKVGICSILQQYYVSLDDRHIGKELKFSLNLHPVGGIHLKLKAKKT